MLIEHIETSDFDRQVEGGAHGCIVLEANAPSIDITQRRLRVTKLRGEPFREGFHDFRLRRGGLAVFPRIMPALPPSDDMSQMPTELDTLDRMLGGGLEFGTTTLVAGQAGTGKSTLSTLIALAATQRGSKAALFLFEERPEVCRERSHGVGLDIAAAETSGMLGLHHYDRSEISAGERQKDFMLSELRHRTANSLSLLKSLFRLTANQHSTVGALVDDFSGRLNVLLGPIHALIRHRVAVQI